MLTEKEAIDLYEQTTGDNLDGCDEEEAHEIVESVRRVREAKSDEVAVSAILWMGHNEDWTRTIVDKIQRA